MISKKVILALLFCFAQGAALAAIKLDVKLVHKRGIDKELVLVSELHSSKVINEGEQVNLQMKNGLRVTLTPYFVPSTEEYGPSDLVKVDGYIVRVGSGLNMSFQDGGLVVKLGEEKQVVLKESEEQLLEVSVTAYVR